MLSLSLSLSLSLTLTHTHTHTHTQRLNYSQHVRFKYCTAAENGRTVKGIPTAPHGKFLEKCIHQENNQSARAAVRLHLGLSEESDPNVSQVLENKQTNETTVPYIQKLIEDFKPATK